MIMGFLWMAGAVLLSYLLGSVPIGYIYVKAMRGMDIREYGSHNPGATNVMRVMGKKHGIVVLALDMLKGLLAVVLLSPMGEAGLISSSGEVWSPVLVGMAAICGHNWPVWLRFRGGRGVATSAGVFLVLQWQSVIIALVVFGIVVMVTRAVSLGSLAGAVAIPIAILCFKAGAVLTGFATVAALLVILRHIPNIKRLMRREELSFTQDEE